MIRDSHVIQIFAEITQTSPATRVVKLANNIEMNFAFPQVIKKLRPTSVSVAVDVNHD